MPELLSLVLTLKPLKLPADPASLPWTRLGAGVSAVIPQDQPLPPYDLHIPMMSLPLAFAARADAREASCWATWN